MMLKKFRIVSLSMLRKRAIKHVQPLEDAEEVSHRITFDPKDKRSEYAEPRAIKHVQPLDDAEEVANRLHFAPLGKRKGGGGGGRGGGGKSSGGGGGRSGGSSSRGYSHGYRTYGGRYGGGSTTPYRTGLISPLGLVPFLIPLAAIALIFPGIWLYDVYSYHYNTAYQYFNETLNTNLSIPVQCLCMKFSDCSCDDDGDTSYLSEIVALNQPNTTVFADINGNWTLLINGTVANGTGPADAGDSISAASVLNIFGYIWMVGVACFLAYTM